MATIRELHGQVVTDLLLGKSVLNTPHSDGPRSKFAYVSARARTALRRIGAMDDSARGVWAITEKGRQVGSAVELPRKYREFRV